MKRDQQTDQEDMGIGISTIPFSELPLESQPNAVRQ